MLCPRKMHSSSKNCPAVKIRTLQSERRKKGLNYHPRTVRVLENQWKTMTTSGTDATFTKPISQ